MDSREPADWADPIEAVESGRLDALALVPGSLGWGTGGRTMGGGRALERDDVEVCSEGGTTARTGVLVGSDVE